MNEDLEHFTLTKLIQGANWNGNSISQVFNSNFDLVDLNFDIIDSNSKNHWVWNPRSNSTKIFVVVYHQLNLKSPHSSNQPGWQIIWKIKVAPRVKHFIWLLFHGCLSTSDFLYKMNLGPDNPCTFCSLSQETINHLFCHCYKITQIWSQLSNNISKHISFPNGLTAGNWVTDCGYSIYIISVITATTWFIWKSRCDAIFRNLSPNFSAIICRALAHVQDHSIGGKDLLGQRLFLNNFSSTDGQFLFYHMRINHKTQVRMIGFFIANAIMLFLLQAVVHTRSLNIPLMIYLSLKLLSKWH